MKEKLTRKDFLKLSTLLALSMPLAGVNGCRPKKESGQAGEIIEEAGPGNPYAANFGIQIFMIREILEKDPAMVMKAIADAGIKNVEFFNPATLAQNVPVARDNGLTPVATHFMPGYVSGKWNEARSMGFAPPENYTIDHIVEDCARFDIRNMGIAIMMPEERQNLDDYKRFADMANKAGEKSKQAGVQLYYHNHSFEFKPDQGTTPMDEMLKTFDPTLVRNELDVFWVTISGNDPVEWIKKLGNRLMYIHLKDLVKDTPADYSVFNVDPAAFTELGSGAIDFRPILAAAKESGVQQVFLDQDHTQMDKIESIRKSVRYFNELRI